MTPLRGFYDFDVEETFVNRSTVAVLLVVMIAGLAGVGVYLRANVDDLIEELIETIGTAATGTRVRVQEVKLSLSDGAGVVSGFTVDNPAGFSQARLFSMDSILIDVDPGSLAEDVYIIESIRVDGAKVLAEQVGGGTNIQALINGMSSGEDDGNGSSSTEEDVRLAVNEISFTSTNLSLKSDIFGERSLTLPDFTVRNLGSAEAGLTPTELGMEITRQLMGQVSDAVVGELKDLALDATRARIRERIGEKAEEGLNKLRGLFDKRD